MKEFVLMNFLRWTKLVLMIRFIYPLGLSCQSKNVLGLILNKFHPQSLIFNQEHVNNAKQEHFNHKISHYVSENIYSEHFANPRLAHIPEVYTSVPF